MRSILDTLPIVLLIGFAACALDEQPQHRVSRFAMGTMVEYTLDAEPDAASRLAIDAAHREVERVSSLLWEDDSTSAVYRFNRSQDTVEVTIEVASFINRSRQYHADTRGAFDITIKPVLELYAFDEDSAQPPSSDALDATLQNVDMSALVVDTPTERDPTDDPPIVVRKRRKEISLAVGGVAKGYAVDRAVSILMEMGTQNAVVNAGGDLYCLGTNHGTPWRVGVRDPDDASAVIEVLHVADAAVATSGDYQQYFDHAGVRYHHILNPTTGRPARTARSATVIAPTAERADALATAAFILGPVEGVVLLDSIGVDGMIVDSSGVIHSTPGLGRYLRDTR